MGGGVIRKVLAIDDEDMILRGYRTGFGRGHEVLTASNVSEAMRLANDEVPDLIVVDLRIGNEWGITLIRRLRLRLPEAKIVLVSGFASIATALSAIRAGADHVMSKPTTATRILRELIADDAADTSQDALPSLARVEWEHLMRAMTDSSGNVTHAARRLKIPRQSLQRKLRKHPPLA